ncbi:hypothetical protein [Prolixibacter bellariivorans]|uniref:hypothetical protein n=1 Tax=Prolixibacter bellariivorans TaxID=314319 RepID=UPI001F1E3F8B|nr:hypothetical protein [Prolixibacter bellariivorans]
MIRTETITYTDSDKLLKAKLVGTIPLTGKNRAFLLLTPLVASQILKPVNRSSWQNSVM